MMVHDLVGWHPMVASSVLVVVGDPEGADEECWAGLMNSVSAPFFKVDGYRGWTSHSSTVSMPGKREKSRSNVRSLVAPCSRHTATI